MQTAQANDVVRAFTPDQSDATATLASVLHRNINKAFGISDNEKTAGNRRPSGSLQ
jgi:hypothetical protein